MTPADDRDFAAAIECRVCHKPFDAGKADKVRDHDHATGKYRGAAHNLYNLRLRISYKITVFIHNSRGYDSHLIVRALDKFPQVPIQVIGQGMEKYLTLAWGDHVIFKDSLQFLNSSLQTLTENLAKSSKDFFLQLRAGFPSITEAKLDLLLRKGVYPYDYMNSWRKFEDRQLPARADFFSQLRDAECSEADHAHAQTVWTEFGCRKMADYHDLYLKCDVLQLADVCEKFRAVSFEVICLCV